MLIIKAKNDSEKTTTIVNKQAILSAVSQILQQMLLHKLDWDELLPKDVETT